MHRRRGSPTRRPDRKDQTGLRCPSGTALKVLRREASLWPGISGCASNRSICLPHHPTNSFQCPAVLLLINLSSQPLLDFFSSASSAYRENFSLPVLNIPEP